MRVLAMLIRTLRNFILLAAIGALSAQIYPSGFTAIAAGSHHSMALKNDGTAWAWGQNDFGQLGDGTTTQWQVTTQVGGLAGVLAISTGDKFSIALKSDGTVWAWGAGSAANFSGLGAITSAVNSAMEPIFNETRRSW